MLSPSALPSAPGAGDYLRPADEGKPAVRGSGDKCGDLMFFSLVCLMFFIDYGFARSLNVVSFLVSSVRPVGRLVFSIRSSHCFPVVLVRLVGRLVSRLVQSSRLACSFRSSHLRLPWASPSLRLVVSSRPWRLACSSRFFFIRLIALRICDEAFLRRRRAIRIIPMGVLLVRSVLVRTGSVRRYPLPALRYPVMRR